MDVQCKDHPRPRPREAASGATSGLAAMHSHHTGAFAERFDLHQSRVDSLAPARREP